jgi:hypothetical protein
LKNCCLDGQWVALLFSGIEFCLQIKLLWVQSPQSLENLAFWWWVVVTWAKGF